MKKYKQLIIEINNFIGLLEKVYNEGHKRIIFNKLTNTDLNINGFKYNIENISNIWSKCKSYTKQFNADGGGQAGKVYEFITNNKIPKEKFIGIDTMVITNIINIKIIKVLSKRIYEYLVKN